MLFPPQLLSTTRARLMIGTDDGTPIATDRLAGIEVRAASDLFLPRSDWPLLTDPLSLTPEGFAVLTNSLNGTNAQLYYLTVEH